MLQQAKRELADLLRRQIHELWQVEYDPVVEVPPRRDLGDLAFPAGLHLARVLKRAPRDIAEELSATLELPSYVRETRIEGAGYLNVYLDRRIIVASLLTDSSEPAALETPFKVVVEHTNINPNKAAHIGHLRNAVLGDILVHVLRHLGYEVEVQNYIDDTGVQVADVVVGFVDLRGLSVEDVAALPEPFDYACWDVYAEVGRWFEEESDRQDLRRSTLHALESGEGERAEMGRIVATRIVGRHLKTMRRIGVEYDLLTHESSILGLDFFSQAFSLLEESGAIRLEEDGKNAGCWVMPLSESDEFKGLEDPDKVIVRSDGTVTYVGKDIAYQLWKFGLLGRDFDYRFWEDESLWQSTVGGVEGHPTFGAGQRVINVIDARQSYLQQIVRAGLEALGFSEQARESIHFAYEFVSLSRSTAEQLGYLEESTDKSGLEMSGRKGIGVKADDLLDQLEAKSRDEIAQRNRDLSEEELNHLAKDIATAALRFFMVKASTTRKIAFDLDEALSFEGDSGPYLQYALVRAQNIFRRITEAGIADTVSTPELESVPDSAWTDDLWDLVLAVAQSPERVRAAGESLELSLIARHALDIAQKFNAAYHKHPILNEEDVGIRTARLATTRVFARGLRELTDLLGIPTPHRM